MYNQLIKKITMSFLMIFSLFITEQYLQIAKFIEDIYLLYFNCNYMKNFIIYNILQTYTNI